MFSVFMDTMGTWSLFWLVNPISLIAMYGEVLGQWGCGCSVELQSASYSAAVMLNLNIVYSRLAVVREFMVVSVIVFECNLSNV